MPERNFISPEILLLLRNIFIEQKWEIENDFLFNRFCETLSFLNEKQQKLLLELTRKFLKIDIAKYHLFLRKSLQLIDIKLLENKKTVYVAPLIAKKDIGRPKSSYMITRFLMGRELRTKEILKIDNLAVLNRITDLTAALNASDWMLMLVDDFVGTGETAEEALNEILQEIKIDEEKIIVLSLLAQQEGYDRLTRKGIKLICAEIRKKGISDEYFGEIQKEYVETMTEIESIIKVKTGYNFGYKGSEALVTLDRTPNNTFPIYWLEKKILGKKFVAPFPRN